MSEEAIKNRVAIESVRVALNTGQITYEQARKKAKPVIDSINEKSKELAKKYGVRPQLVSFEGLMR